MGVTRRHFASLGAVFVATTSVGFKVLSDGSPPEQRVVKPRTKTKKCCIDNRKLNALKRKIRELARHHNTLARRNMQMRKLASQAIAELETQVGRTSGLTRDQVIGVDAVSAGFSKFLRKGRDFSDEINLVGNRLAKAELNCEEAAKTNDCGQRKRRMNNALRELERATRDLEKINGVGVRFSYIELGKLPKSLTNRLRKTKQMLSLSDMDSDFWQRSVRDAKASQVEMKAFKKQMLAGC